MNDVKQTSITAGVTENETQKQYRQTLQSPREAVPYLIGKENRFTIGNNGTIRNASGDGVLVEQLFTYILLEYNKEVGIENAARAALNRAYDEENKILKRTYKPLLETLPIIRPVTDILLKHALNEFLDEQKASSFRTLRAELTCKEENLEPLKTFCLAAFGPDNLELNIMVFAHWIAGVKRKANGDLTTNCESIMPVIVGGQGIGKSSVLKMLAIPLSDYTIHMRLNSLCDDRNGRVFQENLINIFDEASAFKKADCDDFKNLTTSTHINYRPMGTNSCEKVENRLSFLASSNVGAALMIKDSTGMRRVFEIRMAGKADFEALNSLNVSALWQGVDERRKDYLESVRSQVEAAQGALVTEDPIQTFIDDMNLKPENGETETNFIFAENLYLEYKRWANDNGHEYVNQVYFGKVLREHGIMPARRIGEKDGKQVRGRGYLVPRNCRCVYVSNLKQIIGGAA